MSLKSLTIKNQSYDLPIYLPDATRAVTKSLDSQDLYAASVRGAVVNTYHLMTVPGNQLLSQLGGVKAFMNYQGLVVSDSGGWQVFSLIKRNGTPGRITDEGVRFVIGGGSSELFTPQKSIQVQFDIGSDIIICLDDFSDPKADYDVVKASVQRTISWAKQSKEEYLKQLASRELTDTTRPFIFAVIQGSHFKDLRKYCAEELIKIGFDGYGYGGYAVDAEGNLDLELSEYIAKLIPDNTVKFALGVGRPNDIVNLHKMGWDIFDCTLPTRDARHRRLYVLRDPDSRDPENFDYLYITKGIYSDDLQPVSPYCDCLTCKNYTRAYLHHLLKIGDTSYLRLATIHNLRFYTQLIERLHQFKNN